MIKTDCGHYEPITETHGYSVQISDNPDEYGVSYEEELVGEACNVWEDYIDSCDSCNHYKKRDNRLTYDDAEIPW